MIPIESKSSDPRSEGRTGEGPEQPRFSAKVIEHGLHPKHLARLDHPDAHGDVCGWCGEVMEVFLHLDADHITRATFWADGCISTVAYGDMIATMVEGGTLEQAEKITPGDLIAALDGLPYASVHCSELSVQAVLQAIADRRKRGQEPAI
jgi:NifU-like protein involved in Fe-S cluster formation